MGERHQRLWWQSWANGRAVPNRESMSIMTVDMAKIEGYDADRRS
jgi:hypothetical protein